MFKIIREEIKNINFTTNFNFGKLKPILLGYGELKDWDFNINNNGYNSEIQIKYSIKMCNKLIEDVLVFDCCVDYKDGAAQSIYNYRLRDIK